MLTVFDENRFAFYFVSFFMFLNSFKIVFCANFFVIYLLIVWERKKCHIKYFRFRIFKLFYKKKKTKNVQNKEVSPQIWKAIKENNFSFINLIAAHTLVVVGNIGDNWVSSSNESSPVRYLRKKFINLTRKWFQIEEKK